MKTSTDGLMALCAHEGIVLSPYRDSVGVWTIGIGHTAAAGPPDPKIFVGELSVRDAFDLLRKDIVKYEAGVNAAVKVPLKQHEFDALVSFHYNTGAIGRATLVKSLNAGHRQSAASEFMNWTKPAAVTKRRQAEQSLFAKGTYPAPVANLYPADAAGRVLWKKARRVDLREHLAPPAPTQPPRDYVPVEPIVPDDPRGFWAWLKWLFARS